MTLTAKVIILVRDENGPVFANDGEDFPLNPGITKAQAGWLVGKAERAAQRAFGNEVPEPPEEY